MISVKFFADWTSDKDIYNIVIKEYDWNSDPDYDILYRLTYEDDYTHAIVFNGKNFESQRKISSNNIIILAQEPSWYLKKSHYFKIDWTNTCKRFYIGNVNCNSKPPFIEKWSYLLPLVNFSSINKYVIEYPIKHKIMNIAYSNKTNGIMYNYRHQIGRHIINNNLDIDIYGHATKLLKKKFGNHKNIKHPFSWENVESIYDKYKFCIAIENSRDPEFFTEKIIIPLLCGCIPLYLGCVNIDKYFKDYVIHLSGNFDQDMKIVNDVLHNPDKYYKVIPIKEIQELIHMKNLIHCEFL